MSINQKYLTGTLLMSASAMGVAQGALDPVVITATRFEQPVTQTIAPVTVITREDIEKKQYGSVDEVLQSVPGVQVSRQGGRGQTQSLYLRGTPRSRHTLVLVDGVNWSDSTTGSAQLEHLSIDQIERIEVVRGPASARYGSDAMGGVVQIFTRRPESREARARLSAGSFGHLGGRVSASQPLGSAASITGGIGYEREDGFDVQPGSNQSDEDGFELTSANLALRSGISEFWSGDVSGQFNQGTSEFDSSSGDMTDFERYRLVSGINRESDRSQVTLSGHYDYNNSVTYGNGTSRADADRYVTEQFGASLDLRYGLSDAIDLTVGSEGRREDVGASTIDYEVSQRDTIAAYGGAAVFGSSWQLDGVVRGTQDDQFGSAVTYNLGVKQSMTSSLSAFASLGTAYAVPTFNELYYPGFANEDLKPEESLTYEGGISWDGSTASASVTAFRSEYTNRISGGENESEATVDGVELASSFRPTSSLTIESTLDLYATEDENGDALIRIPDYSGTVGVDMTRGAWNVAAEYLFEGERRDIVNGSFPTEYTVVGAYQTVSANARFAATDGLSIGMRAENLLDADYQVTDGYATAGRNYRAELTYSL